MAKALTHMDHGDRSLSAGNEPDTPCVVTMRSCEVISIPIPQRKKLRLKGQAIGLGSLGE